MIAPSPTYQIIDTDHTRVGRWMEEKGSWQHREGSTCIGLARKGELVAGTMYSNLNGSSIFASIVIAGPITRKWLWYIYAYPFIQCQAKVILGLIASDNIKSIMLVERMGFTSVVDIPHADPSGLLCLYSMHREDCRFIRSPYHG